jgi:hypothetical protein
MGLGAVCPRAEALANKLDFFGPRRGSSKIIALLNASVI